MARAHKPGGYTVVIPAFNAADTVGDAVRSVLQQTVPPDLVLVVDDGSSDDTGTLAAALDRRVTVIRQDNAGSGAATNAGLAQVATPLVAFLDDDDVWLPHKAERQLALLEREPALDGVMARCETFRGSPEAPEIVDVRDQWTRTTLMMRSAAAREIGPYVLNGRADTVEWLARGRQLGLAFVMMPEVLARRRIRPDSMSFGRDARKDLNYVRAMKLVLDRRRAGGKPPEG